MFCCSNGSPDQQRMAAERIRFLILKATSSDEHTRLKEEVVAAAKAWYQAWIGGTVPQVDDAEFELRQGMVRLLKFEQVEEQK